MARSITFEQPTDTCLFTPLQLQPVTAVRFGMSTWARWLNEHLVCFPSLVRDHEVGAVVVGAHITWLDRCGFFDCEGLRVRGEVRVIHKKALLREDFRIFAVGGSCDGKAIADGIGIMRPLHVARNAGLSATPIPVPAALLERFQPDEIDDDAVAARPVSETIKRVEGMTPLAEGEVRAFCSRAMSEVADQWSFVEVPALASQGREQLVLSKKADLRRGLRQPLRELHVEYRSPAFSFDELVVRTRAFAIESDLVFLHAIQSTRDGSELAVIVERF
jgi:hypothetical protein